MIHIPSEEEILASWNKNYEKPVVSFLCTSYNHEMYIEDAIKGFLNQRTPYPFEIVIHDDKSTDNTQQIIKKYQAKYPKIIKTIFQNENQHSRGISPLLIGLGLCDGDYIAICEGDDYWINSEKTTKQLDLMLNDSSITMVVSPGKTDVQGVIGGIIGDHGSEVKQISAQYILNSPRSLAPTASYLVEKTHLINALETFSTAPVGDFFIEIYNAVYGKLVYSPEVSCVYRKMVNNSWSHTMASNLQKRIEHSESLMAVISETHNMKGFENLDWSEIQSRNLFNLAINHLMHRKFNGFRRYLVLSNKYKKLEGKKRVLYQLRHFGSLLYPLLPTIKLVHNLTK